MSSNIRNNSSFVSARSMAMRVPLCLFHIETSIKRAYQSESLFHYHPNATIKSKTSPAENYALPYSFYSFADNKTLSSNCEPDSFQLGAIHPAIAGYTAPN